MIGRFVPKVLCDVARLRSLGVLGLALLGFTAPQLAAQKLAIRASKVLTGTGEAIEDAVILIEDGKVRAVGKGLAIPAGTPIVEHDGVAMPGMIDLSASLGGPRLAEDQEGLSPDLKVIDGVDPWDESFEAWLSAGITTVQLSPAMNSTLPGSGAVVKTGGELRARIVRSDSGLQVGFHDGARRRDRAPTSLMGAVQALRDLAAPASAAAHPSVAQAAKGELPVWMRANDAGEVRAAARLARELGWKARLLAPRYPSEVLATAQAFGMPIVLAPIDFGVDERTERSYGALGATAHPLGFASFATGGGDPGLRRAAALAVRHGLDASIAERALTGGASRLLGLEARLGTLSAGRDADVVLLDGHPLDFGTRVVAVYIDGKLAHQAGGER